MLVAVLLTLALAECSDCEESLQLVQRKAEKGSAGGLEAESFTKIAPCEGPVQVLTDVDDTFISSGGTWPNGCDGVYAKGVVYPGFAQFVVELARGPEEKLHVLRPAIFSARPESLTFLRVGRDSPMAGALDPLTKNDPADWDLYNAEIKIEVPSDLKAYNYQKGGFERVLQNASGVPYTGFGLNVAGSKYGHLSDGTNFGSIGETKFENFQEVFHEEMAQDSQKVCAIFVGDDGQGDCEPASEKMRKWTKPQTKELALKAAFIHSLTCDDKPICEAAPASPGAAPRYLFKTYLDAAQEAQQNNLISEQGLQRVRTAVETFFEVYCNEDGTSRAPESLSKLGCEQLWNALQAVPKASGSFTEPASATRPARRFEAWCLHCCNGQISNGRGTYEFERQTFRCHNMWHTPSWWRPNWGAEDGTCHSHCHSRA